MEEERGSIQHMQKHEERKYIFTKKFSFPVHALQFANKCRLSAHYLHSQLYTSYSIRASLARHIRQVQTQCAVRLTAVFVQQRLRAPQRAVAESAYLRLEVTPGRSFWTESEEYDTRGFTAQITPKLTYLQRCTCMLLKTSLARRREDLEKSAKTTQFY